MPAQSGSTPKLDPSCQAMQVMRRHGNGDADGNADGERRKRDAHWIAAKPNKAHAVMGISPLPSMRG